MAQRIDPTLLARLGSLPIQARVIVEGALSGLHRAAVHGSSVEFAEHKEYSPGDELRHVDWKAYAKLSRRRRALVVLVSDLFDPDDETVRALAQLRAQRHDVSVLHLLDPHERS